MVQRRFSRLLTALLSLLMTALIVVGCVYFYMMVSLPSAAALNDMRMQIPLSVYTSDHKLMAIYGEKRRIPVTLDEAPPLLVKAILATEDKRFYDHPGVDVVGLGRATWRLLLTGKKSEGASTITMQVARNFFLTRKKTYGRKIKEILLAIKINQLFTKEKVLELYLNKIYLGHRAYGVKAAAQVYYDKPLAELTVAELAMLAGLPKAPSRDNPITNPAKAKERRDHVLSRMLVTGDIDQQTYQQALDEPVNASYHGLKTDLEASYVAEMVREEMVSRFGKDAYTKGIKVVTTIDSGYQRAANDAVSKGVRGYDMSHGYRGPIKHVDIESEAVPTILVDDAVGGTVGNYSDAGWMSAEIYDVGSEHMVDSKSEAGGVLTPAPVPAPQPVWVKALADIPRNGKDQAALVWHVAGQAVTVKLVDGQEAEIPLANLRWARPVLADGALGAKPSKASDILRPGDVVWVEKTKWSWGLRQSPEVEAALVAMDQHSGAVLALTGGYRFQHSHFNRVTQAKRQPGSSFKPFIYAAALANGYTLASVIQDAPLVTADAVDQQWRPQNDKKVFYGPTRLRVGLEKSLNTVTARLLQAVGLPETERYLRHLGFDKAAVPSDFTLALGSGDITPLDLTRGYAEIANGGYAVTPHVIQSVTLSQSKEPAAPYAPLLACDACVASDQLAPRLITADVSYLMDSALKGVVLHGTGRAAKELQRSDLAGKTGSTGADGWFVGYGAGVVATAWMGFDHPKPLQAYGSQTALPMWIDFMRVVTESRPEKVMPQPSDIVSVRIDPKSGLLARPGEAGYFEVFRKTHVPKTYSQAQASVSGAKKQRSDAPIF